MKEEKKTTTKKTTTKKAAAKKEPATKKATSTKSTTTKKAAPKKATTAKKTTATKKTPAKKTTAAKSTATKKATTKKAEPVKATSTKKTTVKKETVEPKVNKVPDVTAVKEEIKETVSNIDTRAIKEKSKNLLDIVFNVYSKPYQTCKEETENREIKNSMILLALIALSMGILISALTYASFHIDVGQFGSVSDYYKVPYFKIFIVWSVISFIMSFLPIVLSHLGGVIFSKNKFTFSGLVNLYSTSLSVVIFINVIAAAFIFAGLFVKFFLLVSLLALLFGVINYIFVYRDLMTFEKSKEAYIFLGMILVWVLGLSIIASLFASGVDGLNAFETITSTMNN